MKKILIRLSAACIIIVAAYFLNRFNVLQNTLNWIDGFGPWGPVIFFLIYIATCVFFVPSFFFTFASGILFGILPGAFLSIAGTAVGSTFALLIGRYFVRGWVYKTFSHDNRFHALDEAVHKKGWKIIVLARMTPIFPFMIGNYAFGISKIKARDYLLASFLGTMPSGLVYAYLGSITGNLAALASPDRARSPLEWMLLAGGFLAATTLTFYIRRISLAALKNDIPS